MTKARIQVKNHWGNGALHVQGVGEEGNRPYGLAVDIRIPVDVRGWLAEQKGTLNSANDVDGGMNKEYLVSTLYMDGDGGVRLLVQGDSNNHEEGGLVELDGESSVVQLLVDWATGNSLVGGGYPPADGEQGS
jgi:hypothetical protein